MSSSIASGVVLPYMGKLCVMACLHVGWKMEEAGIGSLEGMQRICWGIYR